MDNSSATTPTDTSTPSYVYVLTTPSHMWDVTMRLIRSMLTSAPLEEELQAVTDADGRPYRLLRLPMPEPVYDEDDRLPATYANFLILNGAVIVPTYSQEEKDAKALSLVADAFPATTS